jgi:hypothetical protein
MVKLAHDVNSRLKNKLDKVDEELVRKLSYTAQGGIVPLTSFMGGVVSQECLKALSGKYTPLSQWVQLLLLR